MGFGGKKKGISLKILTGVSGIGSPEPPSPCWAIYLLPNFPGLYCLEDFAALTCIPGIGNKTAKRLVYELQSDKIKKSELCGRTDLSPAGEKRSENYWG